MKIENIVGSVGAGLMQFKFRLKSKFGGHTYAQAWCDTGGAET